MKPLGRVAFREWAPDLPPLVNPGLTVARNVLPGVAGYMPVPGLEDQFTDTLDARARGAISGISQSGVAFGFVGDATDLYSITSAGIANVTRTVGGDYSASDTAQWHFAQYGNVVIGLNPNDDIQEFTLGSSTNFAQLSADAPTGRYIGVIGPQLVVGNLVTDPYLSDDLPATFRYPALGNPSSWPDPTDLDAALPVQAGATTIQGSGGVIQAIVGGTEVGAVFQERQVVRVEYVGGDVIFDVRQVEKSRGLLAPRAAVAFERKVLFLAEDGWRIFDYTTSTPIGEQRVNKSFLADLDESHLDRISALLHPDLPVIVVAYPGVGNSGGTPNKLLFWNYKIDRWADGEQALELLARIVPVSLTLDDLLGDLDADYPASFDAAVSGFGFGMLGAYTTIHRLAGFTGTSLAGTLETGDQEHVPGRLSLVSKVLPLVDGNPTIQIAGRNKRDETVTFGTAAARNAEGKCPVRIKARYHRYRVNLPAGWSEHAVGLDVEGAPAGMR